MSYTFAMEIRFHADKKKIANVTKPSLQPSLK